MGLTSRREIDRGELLWPAEDEASESLGLNRHYVDLRGMTAEDVAFYLEGEAKFEKRLAKTGEYEEAFDYWDEGWGSGCYDISVFMTYGPVIGLDPGVAVSSIGCIPFSSRNGGFTADHIPATTPLRRVLHPARAACGAA